MIEVYTSSSVELIITYKVTMYGHATCFSLGMKGFPLYQEHSIKYNESSGKYPIL